MSAQYVVSGKAKQWAYHSMSFIGEDAVEFYQDHAGRQSQS